MLQLDLDFYQTFPAIKNEANIAKAWHVISEKLTYPSLPLVKGMHALTIHVCTSTSR